MGRVVDDVLVLQSRAHTANPQIFFTHADTSVPSVHHGFAFLHLNVDLGIGAMRGFKHSFS